MALKKKSKVSAEFSMSSLTDIIFLLLIFFMLTSSVVVPNALNLKMPGDPKSSVVVDKTPKKVKITGTNTFYIGGKKFSKAAVEKELRRLARVESKNSGKKLDMTLTPSKRATNESVVFILDIMRRANINCILAVAE